MRCLKATFVLIVIVVVSAYAGRRSILESIGSFLLVRDTPQAAGAIVVLSGSLPDRILEAVDLYKAGLAPLLLLTREPAPPGIEALRQRGGRLPEHHEQNRQIAEDLGVPAAAIRIVPRRVGSTFAEASELVRFLRREGIHSILLVTSNAHARRARWIFEHLAQGDPRIAICPSRYDPFSPKDWWQYRGFVRRVVIEYGKLLTFLVVDRWHNLDTTTQADAPGQSANDSDR
ncbi:MAG: YdcF family protein [Deltaproteobacteria bacterium]|nr:YdcF family protein [Deltaproteobacteria bacterium]